ncbi:hypothetical protein Tco_0573998 [Tanacetum coccineum]
MGSQRTKEDEVQKISTSMFVTNFPEQVCAKDLWNAYKQHGHVVDAFIPNKRSKAGESRDTSNGIKKDNGQRDNTSSYAHVVKSQIQENRERDSKPVLVLDDSCVNKQDYSCCLNGKVKEFGALANLKVVLGNKGLTDIDIRYLGGLWVMIVFDSVEVKEKFLFCTGASSWIASKWGTLLNVENLEKGDCHSKKLCVYTKGMSNIFESFKIIYQGKAYWVRAIEIPGWTSDFDEQNDEESDSEDEGFEGVFKEDIGGSDEEEQGENKVSMVPDTVVEEENPKSMDGDVSSGQNGIQSDYPFNIYSLLNKNNMKDNKESSTKESLEYPPGFTPREDVVENVEMDNQRKSFDCDFGNVRNISDQENSSPRYNTYKKEGRESVG